MSRRDLEATNRFFAASIMREQQQQHFSGFPLGTFSLSRRHSSLSTNATKERSSHDSRTQRSNSISSAVVQPHGSIPFPSRCSYDSSKRRTSLATASKHKDSSNNPLEQYSLVVLGVGGVGKTGKHSKPIFIC